MIFILTLYLSNMFTVISLSHSSKLHQCCSMIVGFIGLIKHFSSVCVVRAHRIRIWKKNNESINLIADCHWAVYWFYRFLANITWIRADVWVKKAFMILKFQIGRFSGIIGRKFDFQLKRQWMKRASSLHSFIFT